jgi:hypothetical protein
MNRVFVVTLVETATNAGIESASRAYQSDDDAAHSITTTIALDTSQTNKRVNRFFLEISNQSATRRGGRFRRLLSPLFERLLSLHAPVLRLSSCPPT